MQIFPQDSIDDIEIKYANHVLDSFPSYKDFWEKFIGVDTSNNDSILPRIPRFPPAFNNRQKYDYKKFQRKLSKLNYSIFCNLVSSCNQYNEYMKTLPITNVHFFFWAMESYETAYFHIGNIIQELIELFKYLKGKNIISNTYSNLSNFLGTSNVNWNILYGEPRIFRNCLVHNFRNIHALAEELYFPDKTERGKFMWREMNFKYLIKGSKKLEDHINIAYKSCEDIYKEIIPLIERYNRRIGVII